MAADSWISPEAVKQRLPVALANMRSKKSAGFQLVVRDRTAGRKFVVPPPSGYIQYQESLPISIDPFL